MNAETSEPTNQNAVDAKPAEQSIVKNGDQGPASKKDSTIDLPMIDLGEAVELVTTIHEKALETASMPEVAKACGYTSPSSTPFYRRAAAARLFKMLSPQKAELTSQALDYFKPDCEDAKQRSLESAVMGVPAYADMVQRYLGKRLNNEIVANSFARTYNLSDACANTCARAFAGSLKFAGLLGADGTVVSPGSLSSAPTTAKAEKPKTDPPVPVAPSGMLSAAEHEGLEKYTLTLDPETKRRIVLFAPPSVKQRELNRIQQWLSFQLIITDADGTP